MDSTNQMKILVAFIVIFLVCGCSTRVRQSVAIDISPASVQSVSPVKLKEARASFATVLSRRGFAVTTNLKDADYIVHAYYAPVPRHPSIGELVELRMEKNPERPLTLQDRPRFSPPITDAISGAEPGSK